MSKSRKNSRESFVDRYESPEHQRELMLEFTQHILSGTSTMDMCKMLEDQLDLNYEQALNFLNNLRVAISKNTATSYPEIIPVHVEIYEEIYRRFGELGVREGELAALKQKEKIMNLLEEESNELIINNNNLIMSNGATGYDYTKLTDKEYERLQQLIDKTQKLKTDE